MRWATARRGCYDLPVASARHQEGTVSPIEPSPFGEMLRTLRRAHGLSLTALGRRIHYSKGYLSKVELGAKPPTPELAERCDRLLDAGGTLIRLAADGAARARGDTAPPGGGPVFLVDGDVIGTGARARDRRSGPVEPRPPWPADEITDGADPQRGGCHEDAITVDACWVAISDTHIVGQIQLRLSPRGRVAWGRFEGTSSLTHFGHRHHVEVQLEMRRGAAEHLNTWRCQYADDQMWSDVLTVGSDPVGASASVYFDGWLVGEGRTRLLTAG
jgi:transcriptional regulator with XRE-family HTH domain